MPADERLRDDFLRDVGLAIVTLGLYMPYWFWRKNEDVRALFPQTSLPGNAALLIAGTTIAIAGPATFGWWNPVGTAASSALALTLFLVGGYLLADNASEMARASGSEFSLDPRLFAVGLGVPWLGVIVGDFVASWPLRALVLMLLLAQPYWFWRLAVGLHELRARAAGAPPSGGGGDVTTAA